MTQVFLSHSTVDADFALRLAADLRAAGIPVWKAPESILEGERWVQAITRGVTTSTHMLILMSPAAVASNWVNFEFEMALSLAMCGQMKIIPLEYQDCTPSASWSVFQYFKGLGSEYEKTLLRLVKHINREQPTHPPEPTSPGTTIHVHIGGYARDVTIAGGNITYRNRPAEPPRSVMQEAKYAQQTEMPKPKRPTTISILDTLPPPFEWCAIPAGQVTLEDNAGIFDVQPFYMAKYPITFERFQTFVDDPQGFKNPAWWRGLAANADHRKAPEHQFFTHDKNLPRDSVSWYDAVAFCRWLSTLVGYEIRLPTEWEWQWAAQGPDGRIYPWGNDPDSSRCNTTGMGRLAETTPVDFYPTGASPYGVIDMSGNVLEWCLNEYLNPKQRKITGSALRAIRSGLIYREGFIGRIDCRCASEPFSRIYDIGFRVVALPQFF